MKTVDRDVKNLSSRTQMLMFIERCSAQMCHALKKAVQEFPDYDLAGVLLAQREVTAKLSAMVDEGCKVDRERRRVV